MRQLLPLLLVFAVGATGVACEPDSGLRRLNFGRTALVTGDFDTVEQLIQEVANTTTVDAEIQLYDGYTDGAHFDTEVPSAETPPTMQVEELLRAATAAGLGQFRTAFFSCGMRGVAQRVYNGVEEDNHLVTDATVLASIGESVERGLRLYFSDWTYDLLETIWPDRIDWIGDDTELDAAQRGRAGPVNARVVDGELAEFMDLNVGDEIEIIFNQGGWAVIQDVVSSVDVLVEADIQYDDPDTGETMTRTSPLVVAFNAGGGRVVFTSFHNEAQITNDARDVLRFQLSQLSQQ
ncbi:MAG TPA: hypothetical protein DIU15_09280 [Deltaproteobacteria bacterium]|nr:hypothetical protein [Deltaproteobacteria bacterium]HCP46222.1 hypothetical protein [Deltaproteobacteria bacterium]